MLIFITEIVHSLLKERWTYHTRFIIKNRAYSNDKGQIKPRFNQLFVLVNHLCFLHNEPLHKMNINLLCCNLNLQHRRLLVRKNDFYSRVLYARILFCTSFLRSRAILSCVPSDTFNVFVL